MHVSVHMRVRKNQDTHAHIHTYIHTGVQHRLQIRNFHERARGAAYRELHVCVCVCVCVCMFAVHLIVGFFVLGGC